MLTPLVLFLSRWVRSTTLETKWRAPRRKRGRTCQRALQARCVTLPGSHRRPAHLRGRLGKRVCVYWRGVAKILCPPGESDTSGDTQSARAQSPLQRVRNGAYHIETQIKYAPFPTTCALPASRPETQSITSVLPRLSIFICPLRNLTPTPNNEAAINSHPIAFISCHLLHYNPLTP